MGMILANLQVFLRNFTTITTHAHHLSDYGTEREILTNLHAFAQLYKTYNAMHTSSQIMGTEREILANLRAFRRGSISLHTHRLS